MMTTRTLFFAGAFLVSTANAFAQAPAGGPSPVGTFNSWSAYTSTDGGAKTCFAATQPTGSKYSRPNVKRGDAFFMITSIPSKNIRNDASTIVGFGFKAGSDVVVDVDGQKFKMFFNDSTAETSWAVPDQEAALIAAMKKGSKMSVSATSGRGTEITDNYSLAGITAALNAVAKECP
jgi:invasion protein IalB